MTPRLKELLDSRRPHWLGLERQNVSWRARPHGYVHTFAARKNPPYLIPRLSRYLTARKRLHCSV